MCYKNMLKNKLEEVINYLKSELSKIRAGRASINMFEDIEVRAYNSKMALKQLASLSSPDPQTIIVQPWDKNVIKDIESAIRSAFEDINPVVDGDVVRIYFPAPTEESRKGLVRNMWKVVEESKVKIRQIREEEVKELKNKQDGSEISEDEFFSEKEKIQETISDYNAKAEQIGKDKEGDIIKI